LSRQPLWRKVDYLPNITSYKPAGVPLAQLQEIRISVEEVEAIRLKDLEGLEQEKCAEKMKVSRSTFARILLSARQKIADALLNGKAIRIEGGNYELAKRSFRCGNGHEWEVPFEVMIEKPPELCPTCNTANIMTLWPWRSEPGMVSMGIKYRGGKDYRREGD
jgi:predicted DNA-binding protein (UPF0251 family)